MKRIDGARQWTENSQNLDTFPSTVELFKCMVTIPGVQNGARSYLFLKILTFCLENSLRLLKNLIYFSVT